jgi:hypothetical protein
MNFCFVYIDLNEGMAMVTGGRYAPLKDATLLGTLICGTAREEMQLDNLKVRVDDVCVSVYERLVRDKCRWLDAQLVFTEATRELQSANVHCHSIVCNPTAPVHHMEGIFDKLVAACLNMTALLAEMTRIRGLQYGPVPPIGAADGAESEVFEYDNLINLAQVKRLMYRNSDSRFQKMFAAASGK